MQVVLGCYGTIRRIGVLPKSPGVYIKRFFRMIVPDRVDHRSTNPDPTYTLLFISQFVILGNTQRLLQPEMIYLKLPVPQNFMMFLSITGAALGPLLTGIISPTVCQPMCTYSFSGISSLLINTCINNYNLGRVPYTSNKGQLFRHSHTYHIIFI